MKIYASAKVLGALRNYYFRYRKAREVGVAVFFGGGGFRFISALAYGAGHGAGPSLHFEQNFAAFTTAIFTADMIRYSTALYSSLLKEYIR